jgi:DNA-binding SARP family transcriptional activator
VIEFRVLGSFEVVKGDRALACGSPRQRALLAVLLVHRGEPVSTERLIDELWGEQAPASATKIVQRYVSNLRKVLGDGLLVTHGHGYLLTPEPDQTDLDHSESLVVDSRRALQHGDARSGATRLREALGLWRGPPLADFAYESFAQPEIARLEESRLTAVEECIDAELELGEHARLVSELEALVRDHPLRERFLAELMLALYRSGRQADALGWVELAAVVRPDDVGSTLARALAVTPLRARVRARRSAATWPASGSCSRSTTSNTSSKQATSSLSARRMPGAGAAGHQPRDSQPRR